MDYSWQAGGIITRVVNGRRVSSLSSSGKNKYSTKMYSFYKWQWDILRGDRSLILNY